MKKTFLALALLLALASPAFATVAVHATKVIDPTTGQPLVSGTLNFNLTALAVTNGAIDPAATVPATGTYTVTMKNGAGSTLWSLSNVVVYSTGFDYDTIVIQAGQTFSFYGFPYTACANTATGTETDVTPNSTWYCAPSNGRLGWINARGSAVPAYPIGLYTGMGAPAFPAADGSTYYDATTPTAPVPYVHLTNWQRLPAPNVTISGQTVDIVDPITSGEMQVVASFIQETDGGGGSFAINSAGINVQGDDGNSGFAVSTATGTIIFDAQTPNDYFGISYTGINFYDADTNKHFWIDASGFHVESYTP